MWTELSCAGSHLPAVAGLPASGLRQPELEKFFLEKAKVALNGGTDFGQVGEGFVRMNPGYTMKKLRDGLSRLERAVRTHSPLFARGDHGRADLAVSLDVLDVIRLARSL